MDLLDPKLLWFLIGLALIIGEFLVPGVLLVFFGVGAWITAVAVWLGLVEGTAPQLAVFGISSLVMLFGLRRLVTSWFVGDSRTDASGADDDFIDKEARVIHSIAGPGADGRVEIKGAEWKARCESPVEAGDTVIIDRRDGLTLHVRPRS